MFRAPRPTRSSRPSPPTLDALLLTLPDEVVVFIVGGTFFVVAPTGLFVIAENPVDVSVGAAAAATAADRIRALLSDTVPLAPFVDAIVVSDSLPGDGLPALVVPRDLVLPTILNGPTVIDPVALEALRTLDFGTLR